MTTFNILAISLAAAGLLSSCFGTKTINPPPKNDFTQLLKQDGFTPFLMPSGSEGAGSLIMINDDGSFQWVGTLETCGFAKWGSIEVKDGPYPGFSGDSSVEYGLNALASVASFGDAEGEAGVKRVKKAKLNIEDAGKESLNYLQVAEIYFDTVKFAQLTPVCRSYLRTGKVRVIGESAYVSKGEFEFFKDTSASLKVSADELTDSVKLSGGLNAQATGEGSMTIDQRIYVAFKQARAFPEAGTLGGATGDWPDATNEVNQALGIE